MAILSFFKKFILSGFLPVFTFFSVANISCSKQRLLNAGFPLYKVLRSTTGNGQLSKLQSFLFVEQLNYPYSIELCISAISISLPIFKLLNCFCGSTASSCFNSVALLVRFKDRKGSTCFFSCSSMAFFCSSNAFPSCE